MSVTINKLTALQIKSAKPKDKEYQLNDGRGLFVRVYPNGKKSYILLINHNTKRIKLTLGDANIISLEQARKIADEKIAVIKGVSGSLSGLNITFKVAFNEFLENKKEQWSPSYYERAISYNRRFFCQFEYIAVSQIARKDVISALNELIKKKNKESFDKACSFLSGFFGWAVQNELCAHNIIKDIEPKYFFGKIDTKHRAHFGELNKIIELKERICGYYGAKEIKLCALLQLYTASRPSEARLATWDEFDLDKGIWLIPASRMKMRKAHEITLNKEILKALKEFKKDDSIGLLFKNGRGKEFSENAVRSMLFVLGYSSADITPHGFRGTFATIANELRDEHGFSNDIVQACLAHEIQNEVASAYNHASYKKQRAKLLAWWAEKLGDIDFEKIKQTSVYS